MNQSATFPLSRFVGIMLSLGGVMTPTVALADEIRLLAQAVPDLQQEMLYEEARSLLIESGWQPVFNSEQVDNPNRSSTVDYLIEEKGYTEVLDCSGTGLGLCLFQFSNASGETLLITTADNESGLDSVVFGWRLEELSGL
jgi:hypothetical protein